jgi:cytochrome b involved in lipid metabolism
VYDVTKFIPDHPGGDAILRNAGKDSTAGFSKVGM